MSIAYGESLTNLMQPFYLLLIIPIMAVGIKIQARDIMGYLVIPFFVLFILQTALVTWWPL
jgi:short-chain fatty acids transporter